MTEKLEAWSLIGRLAHQVRDWNEPYTEDVFKGTLASAGFSTKKVVDRIEALWENADLSVTEKADELRKAYPGKLSGRAAIILIIIASQTHGTRSVLETMQQMQEFKVRLRR